MIENQFISYMDQSSTLSHPQLQSRPKLQPRPLRLPASAASRDDILFLHPAYKEPFNLLLKLPRIDPVSYSAAASTGSTAATYGVHHTTALVACQIVANNAFDGVLSYDPEGTRPVCIRTDQDDNSNIILEDNEYYFVVPSSPHAASENDDNNKKEPYAIVPSFEDWAFPHGRIPSLWRSIDSTWPNTNTLANDGAGGGMGILPRCAVSNVTWAIDKCHLVPKYQEDWYHKNGMARYRSTGSLDIDDPANLCILRKDIYAALDNFIFAVVPKRYGFVVHALQVWGPWSEFAVEFHDVPFCGAVNVNYLFARFAAAIFMLIKPFVTNAHVCRRVARRLECPDKGLATSFETKIEWMTGRELSDSYAGGKSRSASPRKRVKGDGNGQQALQQRHRQRFDLDTSSTNWSSIDGASLTSDSEESMHEIEVLETPINTTDCYNVWDDLSEGHEQCDDQELRGRTRKTRSECKRL
ncbi:hypothetical protein E0Z10_g9292 [Xylaria hypoxylon]|uniref:HNH nuclease domain-containing protein n=1 Tax=Xylaria hypoxylon TaxID=37992 RepID=A0A4Z0YJM5_9PEZI|nr:hypothetical protein E0Z10_g9292 [Xylaria hypoxylon]